MVLPFPEKSYLIGSSCYFSNSQTAYHKSSHQLLFIFPLWNWGRFWIGLTLGVLSVLTHCFCFFPLLVLIGFSHSFPWSKLCPPPFFFNCAPFWVYIHMSMCGAPCEGFDCLFITINSLVYRYILASSLARYLDGTYCFVWDMVLPQNCFNFEKMV